MTHRELTGDWGMQPAEQNTLHTGSENPLKELIDEQDNPFRNYLLT